jgi:hypothetical protein
MIKKVIGLDLSLIVVSNVNRKEEALRLVEEPVSNAHNEYTTTTVQENDRI